MKRFFESFVDCFDSFVMPPKKKQARFVPRRAVGCKSFVESEDRVLIDLSLLSGVLPQAAVCAMCKRGSLVLKIGERRFGFACKLLLECTYE